MSPYMTDSGLELVLHIAMQKRRRPLAGYMSIVQTDVHASMRSILVDWLVEVSLVSLTSFACSCNSCKVLGQLLQDAGVRLRDAFLTRHTVTVSHGRTYSHTVVCLRPA